MIKLGFALLVSGATIAFLSDTPEVPQVFALAGLFLAAVGILYAIWKAYRRFCHKFFSHFERDEDGDIEIVYDEEEEDDYPSVLINPTPTAQVPTDDDAFPADLDKAIKKLQTRLYRLYDRRDRAMAINRTSNSAWAKYTNSKEWRGLAYDIQYVENQIDYLTRAAN